MAGWASRLDSLFDVAVNSWIGNCTLGPWPIVLVVVIQPSPIVLDVYTDHGAVPINQGTVDVAPNLFPLLISWFIDLANSFAVVI